MSGSGEGRRRSPIRTLQVAARPDGGPWRAAVGWGPWREPAAGPSRLPRSRDRPRRRPCSSARATRRGPPAPGSRGPARRRPRWRPPAGPEPPAPGIESGRTTVIGLGADGASATVRGRRTVRGRFGGTWLRGAGRSAASTRGSTIGGLEETTVDRLRDGGPQPRAGASKPPHRRTEPDRRDGRAGVLVGCRRSAPAISRAGAAAWGGGPGQRRRPCPPSVARGGEGEKVALEARPTR